MEHLKHRFCSDLDQKQAFFWSKSELETPETPETLETLETPETPGFLGALWAGENGCSGLRILLALCELIFEVLFVFIMGGVFLQRYGVEVVEINPNVARLICGK